MKHNISLDSDYVAEVAEEVDSCLKNRFIIEIAYYTKHQKTHFTSLTAGLFGASRRPGTPVAPLIVVALFVSVMVLHTRHHATESSRFGRSLFVDQSLEVGGGLVRHRNHGNQILVVLHQHQVVGHRLDQRAQWWEAHSLVRHKTTGYVAAKCWCFKPNINDKYGLIIIRWKITPLCTYSCNIYN